MHLVEGAIDAHGGTEARDVLVLLQATQDGPEGGSNEVSGAVRDDGADVLNGNTVVRRWLHTQTVQYLFGFAQAFLAPEEQTMQG